RSDASMAANVASSSSTGDRSPRRNASTREHASCCHGMSGTPRSSLVAPVPHQPHSARPSVAVMGASWSVLEQNIAEIATEWRSARADRQARRHLDPADFERLASAGFLHVAVPEEMGGLWRGVAETTRPVCESLRALAAADPSVALVASMHPAVLGFWLAL